MTYDRAYTAWSRGRTVSWKGTGKQRELGRITLPDIPRRRFFVRQKNNPFVKLMRANQLSFASAE